MKNSNDTAGIVVGYDGSTDAGRALQWSIRTAELTQAEICVVVAAPSVTTPGRGLTDYEQELADEAEARATAALEAAGNARGEIVVIPGGPLPVLLAAAENADLLVVGSVGRGAFESATLGSVSQHLAGHSTCPVAVVRRARNPHARRIVVGIDGSPSSTRALAYAIERASLTGEDVLAVHAYQFSAYPGSGLGVLPVDVYAEGVDEARRLAADLVAGATVDHPHVHLESTALIGRAARVLSHLSEDASLVVVGSRGRNPWKQLLLGSVSSATLHRAGCTVVVVR